MCRVLDECPRPVVEDWAAQRISDPDDADDADAIVEEVRRYAAADPDRGALNPDQAITVQQAILGFTLNGAKCLDFGWAERIGSIEAGKLADMIVIDQNILEVPGADIHKTRVLTTVVGGRVIYESPGNGG